MGRTKYAFKNIAFGYMGNFLGIILGFLLRTVFISKLDLTLLGVNGLYTGILSVLSMAELGIGTAMNYSLYAPVAGGNISKIKSYMKLYQKAYYIIAAVVSLIGLSIAPFLPYLIQEPGQLTISQLTLYYFIFLFNTVSTYLVAYKYSLVNAEQKNYIQTNIITISNLAAVLLQIVVLLLTADFLAYLLAAAAVELIQKLFANAYLNRLYPYLKDKDAEKLSKEETKPIIRNTQALVFHKIGDVARLQTDNIIISTFINITLVGIVSNYNLIVTSVSAFVNIIFNSVLSGFGNLIATEDGERQYHMFRVYRFAAAWIYGFTAVGFTVLLSPFVEIWLGVERLLPETVVILMMVDYYFKGERIVLSNFKTAAGVFAADKYLALIQGGVNLAISIVLVKRIGLAGVYIGTIISGLIANVTKPCLIYKICFAKKAGSYFMESIGFLAMLVLSLVIILPIGKLVLVEINTASFLAMFLVITVTVNGIFILFCHRTEEFRYLAGVLRRGKGRKKTW